jgi:hypothetical protein
MTRSLFPDADRARRQIARHVHRESAAVTVRRPRWVNINGPHLYASVSASGQDDTAAVQAYIDAVAGPVELGAAGNAIGRAPAV